MDYAVCSTNKDPEVLERANKLADEIDCPVIEVQDSNKYEAVLYLSKQGSYLGLNQYGLGCSGDNIISAGWHSLDFLSKAGRRSDQPLLKAVRGSKRPLGKKGIILDGTAGLGYDSWLLANFGYQVLAVERNPVLYALLRESLSIAEIDYPEIAGRMRIENADANDILYRLIQKKKDPDMGCNCPWDNWPDPDVIYLDPLFPKEKPEKRAVKKRMRLVRKVLQEEPMDLGLLQRSILVAKRRVVLKRPLKSEIIRIGKGQPVSRTLGRAVRYDVYSSRKTACNISDCNS